MILDFNKTYLLENERVKLIPLTKEHIEDLLIWVNDSFIWRYLFTKPTTKEAMNEYVSQALQNRKSQKEYPFVVYDTYHKSFAGMTRLYEYSQEYKTIKLGHTWYGKLFRGSGLNKNVKFVLFEFIFDTLQLERVGFGVHSENVTSLYALKSVGCKQEGKLRSMFPSIRTNKRSDAILFSLLKHEWLDEVKTNLAGKLKTIEL